MGATEDVVEFPSLMEEAPVFEEGEAETGTTALVVSSESWSTRTNDMLDILKRQFEHKVLRWLCICVCDCHNYNFGRVVAGEHNVSGALQGRKPSHGRGLLHGGAAAEDMGPRGDGPDRALRSHLGRPDL